MGNNIVAVHDFGFHAVAFSFDNKEAFTIDILDRDGNNIICIG